LATFPCRNLTKLCIKSKFIEVLPPLPPKLKYLDVSYCTKVHQLPALPPTLQKLRCEGCVALGELPSTLSSTAVSRLSCRDCKQLEGLPQLPLGLVQLELWGCKKLRSLPALPEGLMYLNVGKCAALAEVSRFEGVCE
jgi:hypothetical protein